MFDAGIDYGLFFAACPLEIGAMVGDLGILAQVTFFNEVPCPHRADCVRKLERGGATMCPAAASLYPELIAVCTE